MDDLVDEILVKIFSKLPVQDLVKCSTICRRWYFLSKTPSLWKRHVLIAWPSQNWLYEKAGGASLNWFKIFQELKSYGWYSPDSMKYFLFCSRLENEPLAPCLRKAFFEKIKSVSEKWVQATPVNMDRSYDENMELYFDTRRLKWIFLDKRRGYMADIFKNKPLKDTTHFVRPYQVIPSCLLMYRWLSIFRLYASPEQLTFYRVWRFSLKHAETGLVFSLYDWKAAMATSFSKGRPFNEKFCDDALELLSLLTHPNFVMHPMGDNNFPLSDRRFYDKIHAAAGGCMQECPDSRKKRSRKRKRPHSPSATINTIFSVNATDVLYQDITERIRKWRARRQASMLDSGEYFPVNSLSNRSSEVSETSSEVTTDFSSDNESVETDLYDTGYVTSCEYFISDAHDRLESIEEQHSIQAALADKWLYTQYEAEQPLMFLYNVDEVNWYLQEIGNVSDGKFAASKVDQSKNSRPIAGCVTNGIVEPISSALALYRLICLFDLNSSMYVCGDFATVWKISFQHKRTGGLVQFKDFNGFIQVNVSMEVDDTSDRGFTYDIDEFRASVTQLLDLLMHDNFCHPYGSVAGAVA